MLELRKEPYAGSLGVLYAGAIFSPRLSRGQQMASDFFVGRELVREPAGEALKI